MSNIARGTQLRKIISNFKKAQICFRGETLWSLCNCDKKLISMTNPAKSVCKSYSASLISAFISNEMAKRSAPTHQKLFSFDLESLLITDLSPERQNDSQTSTSESYKPSKKFKTKDNIALPTNRVKSTIEKSENVQMEKNERNEEVYDVASFFENVGNDFNKSLQMRKSKLGQFTETILSMYQSKISEMIKKHEAEIEELKDRTVNHIEEELSKCEEEFKKLKQQENKLMKIFEQQMKLLQKTAETQCEWIQYFRKLHQNFVQNFEELKKKHKNESLDLKKSLTVNVSDLQNKFLLDSKKEEMQTMKKYFSSVYF